MDIDQYKNFLLSRISGAKLVSGGTEIQCRCFNTSCEDYYDYKSHGHFTIHIPQNESDPSYFNCFKCGYSGIVTHNKLLEWDIFEASIAEELYKYNSTISHSKKNDKYFKRTIHNVYNVPTMRDITTYKRQYICNRLGVDLSINDIVNLKIVLNLYDIINVNNISKLTREKSIVDQLDINFLGFLSVDNSFINMRRLCDSGLVYKSIDKRYINYKLFDKFDTSERFYVIPTVIHDLYSPKPIKINISEGPFDILSVYINLRNREEGIYIAGTGSNYYGIILYCLQVFGVINAEIHFYADNDVTGTTKLNSALKNIKDLRLPTYVHKNTFEGEKDFGVSLDKIKESIIKI